MCHWMAVACMIRHHYISLHELTMWRSAYMSSPRGDHMIAAVNARRSRGYIYIETPY